MTDTNSSTSTMAVPAASSAVSLRASLRVSARAAQTLTDNICRSARAIQAGLDSLAGNNAAALIQLESNRDAALAALVAGVVTDVVTADILAVFSSGIEAVRVAALVKQVGLDAELVAADAALAEASDVYEILTHVRCCQGLLS